MLRKEPVLGYIRGYERLSGLSQDWVISGLYEVSRVIIGMDMYPDIAVRYIYIYIYIYIQRDSSIRVIRVIRVIRAIRVPQSSQIRRNVRVILMS